MQFLRAGILPSDGQVPILRHLPIGIYRDMSVLLVGFLRKSENSTDGIVIARDSSMTSERETHRGSRAEA